MAARKKTAKAATKRKLGGARKAAKKPSKRTAKRPAEEAREGQAELDVLEVRVGDTIAVWWGDGWAKVIALAIHGGPGGGVAVLFEDGTADVVLDTGPSHGVHVARGARGTGVTVAEVLGEKVWRR